MNCRKDWILNDLAFESNTFFEEIVEISNQVCGFGVPDGCAGPENCRAFPQENLQPGLAMIPLHATPG